MEMANRRLIRGQGLRVRGGEDRILISFLIIYNSRIL